MLAEVCEGQRESRGHAQPLPDAQRRKGGEVRRDREERRRQRQHGEGDEDAAPSVDGAAEVGHSEPRDRHAHRCGVDGETHGSRGHPIGFRQRRQDRLGAEQVDDGEERNEADEQRACKRAGAVLVHVHRLHRHGVGGTEIHSRGPIRSRERWRPRSRRAPDSCALRRLTSCGRPRACRRGTGPPTAARPGSCWCSSTSAARPFSRPRPRPSCVRSGPSSCWRTR